MDDAAVTKVIKRRSRDGSLYKCPCCGRPTLQERGLGEVCHVCYWQDDGQDDPYADQVWGKSNGKLSLTKARQNFLQCSAYDPRIGSDPAADAAKAAAPPKPVALRPPAPVLPPPPSWWTRLSNRQKIILGAEGVALLFAVLCAFWFASGRLTGEMLRDRGYYLWAKGEGHYRSDYLSTFSRDRKLQQRFLGQPVDTLHPYFPNLYGAGRFDAASLQAINPGHTFPRIEGHRVQTYSLDSWLGGRVYCVLVLGGDVKDFFFHEPLSYVSLHQRRVEVLCVGR